MGAAKALSGSFAADLLSSSFSFWTGLPFEYVFIPHALYCCLAGSEFKNRWLVHLLLTYLWGNGGGLITALLMQNPNIAPLSFFQADFIPAAWIACWWLVNWLPGGHVARLCGVQPVLLVIKSCTMLLRAQLIPYRVDQAVGMFPGQAAPALILGSIAGCGGRLLADAIMTGWQSHPGLAELTSPSFVSRSAALAACTYYTLAYRLQLLPPQAAAGLVVSLLMLHCLASELSGLPLDFTQPIAEGLHFITRVPLPPPQPQAAPRGGGKSPAKKQQAAAGVCTPAKSPPARSPAPGSSKKGTPVLASAAAAGTSAAAASSPAAPATARQKRAAAAVAAAAAALDGDAGAGEAFAEPQEPGTASKQLPKRAAASQAAAGSDAEVVKGGVATRRSQRWAAAAVPAYA